MKRNLMVYFILLIAASCTQREEMITAFSDYEAYLPHAKMASNDPIEEELKFWSHRLMKNKKDEASLVKLAALYAESFKASGLIQDILISDSLYNIALKNTPGGDVDIYHCLSTNAITQHKFRLAREYAQQALALKDKKAATLLILTDVSLELGDHANANRILKQFTNKHSFAYLIRDAKVKDHEGKLDTAILRMEKAYQRIKGNKPLAQWTLSNLADMYGHAGRIEEAYQTYLTILKNSPQHEYALKGIAWIALSNDHNTVDSKTIMNTLASRKRMPEAYLMLAEIAEVEGDETEKTNHLKKFASMVSQPAYKTMYHKYLATLEAEAFKNSEGCLAIAQEEIANRPTPQSYDLLAWGYYHQKDFAQALAIATRKVEHQTFEPDAYYHLGMIYLSAGNTPKARYYLKKALASHFELGPSITKKINDTLNTL